MHRAAKILARNTSNVNKSSFLWALCCGLLLSSISPLSLAAPVPQALDKAFESADANGMIRVIVTLKEADQELKQLRKQEREALKASNLPPEADINIAQSVPERKRNRRDIIARHQRKVTKNLDRGNYRLGRAFETLPFSVIQVNRNGLNQLLADTSIHVSAEKLFRPLLGSSVPLILGDENFDGSSPYDVTEPGNSTRGTDWAVAIIDTGIDKSISLLGGRVVSEACYSSVLAGSSADALCPGPDKTQSIAVDSGLPCDTNIDSICNHGTLMAGVAAGDGDGLIYSFDGVATSADIVSINVFSNYVQLPADNYMAALSSDILRGLDRVSQLVNDGMSISSVLISLGSDIGEVANCDLTEGGFKSAIDSLKQQGVATVVASGNQGYTAGFNLPACISTAISVGASDDSDIKWTSSNEGAGLDLYAPGVNIESSDIGSGSVIDSGTSYSAAHVAGAWAVLKEAYPAATVDQIQSLLSTTGVVIPTAIPSGAKRVQLDAALDLIPTIDEPSFYVVPIPQGGAAVFSL